MDYVYVCLLEGERIAEVGTESKERKRGSHAIEGVARNAMLFSRDPDTPVSTFSLSLRLSCEHSHPLFLFFIIFSFLGVFHNGKEQTKLIYD